MKIIGKKLNAKTDSGLALRQIKITADNVEEANFLAIVYRLFVCPDTVTLQEKREVASLLELGHIITEEKGKSDENLQVQVEH
jgi:uncharacterized protein (DUF2344 family)